MFIGGLLDGMTDAQLRERVGAGRSPWWEVGHIAGTRRTLRRLLGESLEAEPWEEPFGMDSDGSIPEGAPSPAAFLEDIAVSGQAITARLNELGSDGLAERTRSFLSGEEVPRAEMVQFLAVHEAYHVGQVGYIRSVHGLPYLA
jgi:uncharacterized damage-inducible protein DinB